MREEKVELRSEVDRGKQRAARWETEFVAAAQAAYQLIQGKAGTHYIIPSTSVNLQPTANCRQVPFVALFHHILWLSQL